VIADYLFDKDIYPVVIICEPYTPGSHVYPRDHTAYANMYDPPSPFFAQLFQQHYRTIDLYEWDDGEWHSFGKLAMSVRKY
jgi:hypothetical protein